MPDIVLDADWSDNPWLSPPDIVVFSDDFERANGSLIGSLTPIGGLAWQKVTVGTVTTSDVVIRSGSAGAIASSANIILARVDAATPDGIIRATFNHGEGNTNNMLPFRIQDSSNFLHLTVISGNWALRKRIGGVISTLALTTIPMADGQAIEVTLHGAHIQVAIDGNTVIDLNETDLSTVTWHGIAGTPTAGAAEPISTWRDISLTIPGAWA